MWNLLIPAVTSIIDKIIPDPAQAAEAKLKALELAQKGELAALDAEMRLALGQIDINKAEAATDPYRGGWRPACGWVCAFGLGYTFILRPLLPFFAGVLGHEVPELPAIDIETLMVLLTGMLGLGGLRSFERVRGKV
jgi:hypothetical protein